MDPLTIWLVFLATLWCIRRAAEDGYAAVRGRESPRIVRRRAAYQLAQQQAVETGRPTIPRAAAGRLAERIANPRPPGPMRRYMAGLWEDSWTDAEEHRKEKRRRRAERATNPKPKQRKLLDTRLCRGGCGLLLVEPWEWCPDCEPAPQDNQRPNEVVGEDAATDPQPASSASDDLMICRKCFAHPVARDAFGYCAPCARLLTCHTCRSYPVETDRDGQCPECSNATAEETPEPTPAPDTTRKDTSPMSTPTEINGDVTSPLEALAFATTCHDLNAAVQDALDTMANNLTGQGVGNECVQIVNDAWAAAEQFGSAALGARDEYARHVATQADIAGDTELRDTVRGTYLDTARA